MKKSRLMPNIAIIASVIVWGISYISTEVCLGYMEPVTLAMLRCVIAAAILLVIWKIREPEKKINKKDIPRLLISGIIGVVLYFIFEINGVKYTSPSIAAIILASIPVISLIAQRVSGRESLTVFKVLGVLLSLAGVALVMGIGKGSINEGGKVIGYLCMLGAAVSWVVFNYITFPLYKSYSPLAITTFQMTAGAAALIPIFLLSGESLPQINAAVTINLMFLAVFCSALGILLYMYAFRSLGIVTTTLYINIQPLITVIASMLLLNDFLTGNQLIGGIMVVAAVYLSTYKKRDLPLAK